MKKSREQRKKLKAKAAKRFEQELKNAIPLEVIIAAIKRAEEWSLPSDATCVYDGHVIIEKGTVVNLDKLQEMLDEASEIK